MTLIDRNAPITILLPSVRKWQGPWEVTKSYVNQPGTRGKLFSAWGRGNGQAVFAHDQEGVKWIRGHHTRRSREGKALLAAAALVLRHG